MSPARAVLIGMLAGGILGTSATASAQAVVRLPITADNSIIDVRGERDFNMGAARSLRVKSFQHHLIVKFDAGDMRGRTVVRATLVYGANAQAESITRVTVSTIQADWGEGDSSGFAESIGGSTFNNAFHGATPDAHTPWAWPGSDFADVVYGNSHSLHSESPPNLADGWFRWELDPDLVHANAVGASYGLSVLEADHDTGRNPTVHDRTNGAFPPYVEVELGPAEGAPGAIVDLADHAEDAELGEVVVSFKVPELAFAYLVTFGAEVPRHLIPFAGAGGTTQTLRLAGLGAPGDQGELTVEAINRSGQRGESSTLRVRVKDEDVVPFADAWIEPEAADPPALQEVGGVRVFVVPETDRLRPDGVFVHPVRQGYRADNPRFRNGVVRLTAARLETVAFVVALEAVGGVVEGVSMAVSPPEGMVARAQPIRSVATSVGPLPEILEEVNTLDLSTNGDPGAPRGSVRYVLVEIDVPRLANVGENPGEIVIASRGEEISLPINLRVLDFALPDSPSWHMDFNTYGWPTFLATFELEQQLGHRFRGSINTLPYGHGGRTRMDMIKPDGAPMDERAYNDIAAGAERGNWAPDFVLAFDPWLRGDGFEDLWRGAPASTFYLTFHENWPLQLNDHRGANAMDPADLPAIYGATWTAILADFGRVASERDWTSTQFHVYLNNKPGGGQNPTPWELDEPSDLWDFKALAYFNGLHTAAAIPADVDIPFRVDISRPQYARGYLRDVDLYVCGGACVNYPRMTADQQTRDGWELWHYGSAAPVPQNLHHPQLWAARSFALGGNGIVPWQTVRFGEGFVAGAADDDQRLALFIEVEDSQTPVVLATLRAAAYRRASQDMEYLRLLERRAGLSRGQMARFIGAHLGVAYEGGHWAQYAASFPQDGFSELAFEGLRAHAAAVIVRIGDGEGGEDGDEGTGDSQPGEGGVEGAPGEGGEEGGAAEEGGEGTDEEPPDDGGGDGPEGGEGTLDGGDVCAPGATQGCVCSDGGSGAQSCREDRSGWLQCVCEAAGGQNVVDTGGGRRTPSDGCGCRAIPGARETPVSRWPDWLLRR